MRVVFSMPTSANRSFHQITRMTLWCSLLLLLWALLMPPVAAAAQTRVSGTVMYNGGKLSALVLANGSHLFTTQGVGTFDMEVPLNENGQVILFSFVDGLAPFSVTLDPHEAVNYTVNMSASGSANVADMSYEISDSQTPGWMKISGSFLFNGAPICGLILANGSHMFSCGDDTGAFDLEAPFDSDGRITLFGFAEGFAPLKKDLCSVCQISGTVTAAAGSVVDGDVNDPASPYRANDSFASAQPISNPVTLGGYVNQRFEGNSGASYASGDNFDYFSVDLSEGQVIRLQMGSDNTYQDDIDIYLMDSSGNVVASSTGIDVLEALTAPTTGSYVLLVEAYLGASNYVLTIGQSLNEADAGFLARQQDFVPGEILVKYRDEEAGLLSAEGFSDRMSAFNLETRSGAPDRASLVQLTGRQPVSGFTGAQTGVTGHSNDIAALKADTIKTIKALRADPRVAYAEPNYYRRPLLTPNDTLYKDQWHYPLINLPQAWDITTGGSDVVVAVVDTGVVLNHPDLQGKLTAGYDFIRNAVGAGDGDGIDANPNDPGDGGSGRTSSFHGTHVAGTIAAASNNGIGVAGVSWGASIMPVRVLGQNGGTTYDVLQGVRYAAGLSNDSGTVPAKRADVINLSLGGGGSSLAEQNVYTEVRNTGAIIVAASGNSNTSIPMYPASYEGVVSVGAASISKTRAPYSNYGSTLDVMAPGGDISRDVNGDGFGDGVLSTHADDSGSTIRLTYNRMQGTSMATPHMAGVVALMKAVNPSLTPSQLDGLLSSGQITEDLGSAGRDDTFGWGLIDAYKAVVAVGGAASNDPFLVSSPSSLNFGTSVTQQSFVLENARGGSLSVSGLMENAAWLTVTAGSTDDAGLGTYTVTVNREGLNPGVYTATITVSSSANTVEIPVIMQLVDSDATADAGRQYVLLVDPDTRQTVSDASINASGGVYTFSMTDVPAGSYELYSGSDHNNDLRICDAAESCGSYPTLGNVTYIQVSEDMSSVDFVVSFDGPLDLQSTNGGSRDGMAIRRPLIKR